MLDMCHDPMETTVGITVLGTEILVSTHSQQIYGFQKYGALRAWQGFRALISFGVWGKVRVTLLITLRTKSADPGGNNYRRWQVVFGPQVLSLRPEAC